MDPLKPMAGGPLRFVNQLPRSVLCALLFAVFGIGSSQSFSQSPSEVAEKKPPVILQTGDGPVILLARDVSIHGTTVRYEPEPHKNTVGYWTKLGDWVSWDFRLLKPGTFKVELTQACGKGSGGSEYNLTVSPVGRATDAGSPETVTPAGAAGAVEQKLTDVVPETGAFTNFVVRTIGQVKLTQPGAYRLAVKPRTKPGLAVMDLRMVKLVPKD